METDKRGTRKLARYRRKLKEGVYDDCGIIDSGKELHIEFRNEFNKKLKDNDNILRKTAFGKKYAKKGYYDYDDSLISSYIFCKTIDIPGDGEWHIDCNGGYEYKIRKGSGFYFRGDTMTSWLTLLNKYLDLYGGLKFLGMPKKGKERIKYLCDPSNYHKGNDCTEKDDIYEAVMKFMKVVYTIGNFCPVPMGFNTGRSSGGDYDYWDLTLMKIREWYISIDRKSLYERDKLICEDLLHNTGNSLACLRWLESFGQGQMGWHNFVDTLYMQDFVYNEENSVVVVEEGRKVVKEYQNEKVNKEYYDVIPFWDGHEWDKEKGTIKVMFPKKNEIKKAFETMVGMIRDRSKRIARALVD